MSTMFHLQELIENPDFFIDGALKNSVFIYPTDTVYGLGGVVTSDVINYINSLKQRSPSKHYSVIAPSFSWIDEHCTVDKKSETIRQEISTQYPNRGITIILPFKKGADFPFSLLTSTEKIGVRVLSHPMQTLIEKLGVPFITTSCNLHGQPPITHPDDAVSNFGEKTVTLLDGGVCSQPPSVIIDYQAGKIVRA